MITNNMVKYFQSLKHQKYRLKYKQFLIEGKRIITEAVKNDFMFHIVLYTEKFKIKNPGFIENLISKGHYIECLSKKKINKIALTKTPSGIIAICNLPEQSQFNFISNNWLYLDQISNPGNLGTLFRTAAWFRIKNIALSPKSLDPYNPKVIRAGMGAHFYLSIHQGININIFKEHNYYTIGADHRGESLNRDFEIPNRWVLVLGGESHGLSKTVDNKLDIMLSIPKNGFGDSLNVSIAGSILLYELYKNQ
ncbi:MAG: hypothetical protein CMG74_05605 [Candidatus Marinimicrobia bacterium]|nr:hypothetical protein [Candidatus Neomarinimicrobiota bacterium]|tara:strand:+ start:654 stop:1406 length:753 start_codon:yes stop_codon:yes gene_type:complete